METKEKIALLINPKANKKKVDKIFSEISATLSAKAIRFETFIDVWPEEINLYAQIWLIGGDGTLNYLINYYAIVNIPIVIFKGGTGNDFATKLYGKVTVPAQINKVLLSEVKRIDAAMCNGKKFINGVGVGFDGEVLKLMTSIRRLGGHFGYLWIVIRKIFSFKEIFYRIQYDDTNLSGKYLLLMITNSTQTGGGFMVSPSAEIDDGKLNMVLCKPQPILKRLKYLTIIKKGKHLNKDFIIHKEIKEVKIECDKETAAQIDGELICAKTFEIKILPNHYLFKY